MNKANRKYYSGLDLLRILAAFAVAFFFHYAIVLGGSPFRGSLVGDFLNTNGGYVVELFFIISGFVIYNAYSERIRDGKCIFTRFLSDRIIRLYPTVIITVIVICIFMWTGYALYNEPITDNANVSIIAIILNIAGLNGGTISEAAGMSVNGPSWYISVLLVCYILFFLIIKLCRQSEGMENVCFVFLIIVGIFLYFHPIQVTFLLMSSARGYVFFFIGVLIAKLQQRVEWRGKILLCTMSIALVFMYAFAYNYDLIINNGLEAGLAVVCPIVIFFINFTPIEYICRNKVVKFLGGISYGVFMWNMPVFIGVLFVERICGASFDYKDVLTYIIIVSINLVCGAISYILIDKKLVNKIKQIRVKNEDKERKESEK